MKSPNRQINHISAFSRSDLWRQQGWTRQHKRRSLREIQHEDWAASARSRR